jgi:alpha-tubulin suppressor-like RCC1 family protein
MRVVTCAAHAGAVCGEGRLFTWGSGCRGALGLGARNDAPEPREVAVGGARVVAIAGADGHMLAIDEGGCVYAWGEGGHGALGLGSADDCLLPAPVCGVLAGRRVTSVSCGAFFSMALDNTGAVFWWGDGKSLVPQEVDGLADKRITALSYGGSANHMGVVTDDGLLFTWGAGWEGQLGQGSFGVMNIPAPALVGRGLQGKQVKQMAGALEYTIVLTDRGEVMGFGSGLLGRLGPCREPCGSAGGRVALKKCCEPCHLQCLLDTEVIEISASHSSAAFLKSDGALCVCGEGWSKPGVQDRLTRLVLPTATATLSHGGGGGGDGGGGGGGRVGASEGGGGGVGGAGYCCGEGGGGGGVELEQVSCCGG